VTTKIITTADGSHSLFDEDLNETYHSIHGAIQESRHVFITNGLEYVLHKNTSEDISILEVGLGTGLNALLTMQYLMELPRVVSYTAVESSPLKEELLAELNYSNLLGLEDAYKGIHQAGWGDSQLLNKNFSLVKLRSRLQDLEFPLSVFDLVYYDAFSPSKQAELWVLPVLEKVACAMKSGGIFVTYCATGQLKRNLKTIGLEVETLAGPPGKKEMVRGMKY
jgi:tRNA U34 5-methylaminomethyl-2-thiouridine-forming methyltransferase MnmC